ncbi:MAG TPA: L,D-transpeptidase family protein [Spongiibacteraceae bacterium]|jgi:murein L,D-transpeptidase YafK
MKIAVFIGVFLFALSSHALDKADAVLVKKSEKTLYLLREGRVLKQYKIMLGPKPKGPKLQEGDERTPEGYYTLDWKNPNSSFYKSIRVSYPNVNDSARAQKYNVDPGNAIMLHGMKNSWNEKTARQALKFNWTDGCIAVKNSDMDEIWEAVDIGTPIEITP